MATEAAWLKGKKIMALTSTGLLIEGLEDGKLNPSHPGR
jgi:hypothetical protein